RAELAGRAVAALEGVVLDERGLERMQVAVAAGPAQSLDRGDLRAVVRDREEEAAVRPPTVEQDRARAALPVVAALLRPHQVELLAQHVEQRGAGIDLDA